MSFPLFPKRVYIETYGCQMNEADSELVGGILSGHGFSFTSEISEADVVLVNTCAVRDNAEVRVRGRLGLFSTYKRKNPDLVVGVLGCMAERLRSRLVERDRLVDIVVGPDEYRKLPELIARAFEGEKGIAVRLSRIENYDDIVPLRTDGVCAWLAIMRGCDKFCSFCVVPFTRGRERSRPLQSILRDVAALAEKGFREVTLLGQNVNSYRDGENDFADLVGCVAAVGCAGGIRRSLTLLPSVLERISATTVLDGLSRRSRFSGSRSLRGTSTIRYRGLSVGRSCRP